MESLITAFKSQTNGAADGTGVLILVHQAKSLLGYVPKFLVDYTLGIQLAVFGDYARSSDKAPSALFTAVFAIFMLAHLYIFIKNYMRGHKFWLSLGFAFYCLLNVIGWILRIVWANNILKMKEGMASNVLLIVPIVLLASFNLVLAQRIFTWRHPHIGSTKLFWGAMIAIYIVVAGVVVMNIVGAVVPYVYFLSESHFTMCKKAVRTASTLCCLYSVLAIILVACAFILKPTTKALSTVTYQPWWIESFSPFYYVPKGAAQHAEESFKVRDPDALNHHRIIASTTQHHETIEKITSVNSKSGRLDHNYSIIIIFLTSLILLIASIFRCVSTFIAGKKADQSWIFKPVVMYIVFGVLETFVNLFYLIGRVDLRFYRPDRLSKSIISSCGSSRHSANEKEPNVSEIQKDSQEYEKTNRV